jgi:hypothetical protein
MRGYLQRLVSTANGAEPLVEPLIRPVFSPAAPPAEQAPSMLGDDARSTQQYRAASASAHVPRGDTRPENEAEDPSRKSAHEAFPRMPLAPLSNFEPLLTAEPAKLEVANTTTAPHASTASAGADEVRASTENTTVYLPLLNARPTAPPHEPVAYGTQEHKQLELPKPTAEPRPAPVSSTATDEIQIHIGRIEITAVPAPVKAAPQKPVYKGPSLQEYLKRRDRSSQ